MSRPYRHRARYFGRSVLDRVPRSIIRDCCDVSLLPPCTDDPIAGGPADKNFEPSPQDQREETPPYQTEENNSE